VEPDATTPPLPPLPQETADRNRRRFSRKANIPRTRIFRNRAGVCGVVNSFAIVYRKMLEIDG
jgi:hypothetical protein